MLWKVFRTNKHKRELASWHSCLLRLCTVCSLIAPPLLTWYPRHLQFLYGMLMMGEKEYETWWRHVGHWEYVSFTGFMLLLEFMGRWILFGVRVFHLDSYGSKANRTTVPHQFWSPCQTVTVRPYVLMLGVWWSMYDVRCLMLNIQCPMSSVILQMSDAP